MRSFYCLLGLLLLLSSSVYANGSIDRFSPTLPLCGGSTGDVYAFAGTGGCDVGGGLFLDTLDASYGLLGNDNTNGHSESKTNPMVSQILLFSVDGNSRGRAGTPVRGQAVNQQVPGDVFNTQVPPSLSPMVSMATCTAAALAGVPRHLLAINQTAHNLIPTIGPGVLNGFVPPAGFDASDNLDAFDVAAFDLTGDNIHDNTIYFTLDPVSPSLGGLSAAHVLFAPPGAAFAPFAPSFALGLNNADDIDALVVWDMQTFGEMNPGSDHAIFSLAPGSPSLAGPDGILGTADDFSPADVFVTDFSGAFCLYVSHNQLQLRHRDNIDALGI